MRNVVNSVEEMVVGYFVHHDSFGIGQIMGVMDGKMEVVFDDLVKYFRFPECFVDHLEIRQKDLQKELQKMALTKMEADQAFEAAKMAYLKSQAHLDKMREDICKKPSRFGYHRNHVESSKSDLDEELSA